MHPIVEEVWMLMRPPENWVPEEQIAEARTLWNAHGYKATWSACAVALFAVQQMAGGINGQPVAVSPPTDGPPEAVLAVVGDRSRAMQAAHATWEVVAGVFTSEHEGLDDPFLEDQLKAVSREFKGAAIYLYAWWAASAVAYMSEVRPDTFESEFSALEAQIERLHRDD